MTLCMLQVGTLFGIVANIMIFVVCRLYAVRISVMLMP